MAVFAKNIEILVVDDTSVSRALLADGLHQIGIVNVRISKDGDEALRALMTKPAHLVLSDYNMPNMNGLELLRALRSYEPTSKIGFILVTGSSDKSLIEEGRRFGLNNFLPKPFTANDLKARIEAVVGKLA